LNEKVVLDAIIDAVWSFHYHRSYSYWLLCYFEWKCFILAPLSLRYFNFGYSFIGWNLRYSSYLSYFQLQIVTLHLLLIYLFYVFLF